MLADPIDDAPSVIPQLNVGKRKGSDLGIARSRSPFVVMLSGALRSACRRDSRFSTRSPIAFSRPSRD